MKGIKAENQKTSGFYPKKPLAFAVIPCIPFIPVKCFAFLCVFAALREATPRLYGLNSLFYQDDLVEAGAALLEMDIRQTL